MAFDVSLSDLNFDINRSRGKLGAHGRKSNGFSTKLGLEQKIAVVIFYEFDFDVNLSFLLQHSQ